MSVWLFGTTSKAVGLLFEPAGVRFSILLWKGDLKGGGYGLIMSNGHLQEEF